MARDITRNINGSVATQTPSISPELRKLIDKHEVRASFGGDEGTNGGGDFEAGAWIAPEAVSEFVKGNAERCEPFYRHWAQAAPKAMIVDFLNVVWTGTKHSGDTKWDMIEHAYPMLFRDYPQWCFRPEMALPCALEFTWFPAAAELAGYLAEQKKWIEDQVWKLRTIATTKVAVPERPKEEPRVPPTQEERDFVSREVARAAGTAKHRDPNAADQIRKFREESGMVPVSLDPPAPEQPGKVRGFSTAGAAMGAYAKQAAQQAQPEASEPPDVIDRKAAEDAVRDRQARRDPDFAYTLERSRRLGLAVDAGGANHGKFIVPMDEPLRGDLRAFYGHACPGYDPPRQATAAERHEASEARNPDGRIDTAVTDTDTPKSRNIRPDTAVVFEDLEEAV